MLLGFLFIMQSPHLHLPMQIGLGPDTYTWIHRYIHTYSQLITTHTRTDTHTHTYLTLSSMTAKFHSIVVTRKIKIDKIKWNKIKKCRNSQKPLTGSGGTVPARRGTSTSLQRYPIDWKDTFPLGCKSDSITVCQVPGLCMRVVSAASELTSPKPTI